MYWANLLHIYQPPGQKKEIIDQVVKESYEQILFILESRPNIKISLNICASLTEQLVEHGYQEILNRIKNLAENDQIELVGSAAYHPILPLLPKSEIIRQIKLNENLNQKYFGKIYQPKGFFLPELAYDKKTARIIQSLGYQWIVLDELAYNGRLHQVCFDKVYQIKDLYPSQQKKTLKVIFRNRGISDVFFGRWLDSLDKFWYALERDQRCERFLVTAFDGENLGHHRKGQEKIWAKILDDKKKVETITFSELVKGKLQQTIEEVKPIDCSWASSSKDLKKNIPYALWQHPKNMLHQLQWALTNLILKNIGKAETDPKFRLARKLLDKSLAGDQYWWASIKPWWNPRIIERRIQKFSQIIKLLEKFLPADVKNNGQNLIQEILAELDRRKKSGHYKIIEKISDWQPN